jgi:3-methyladenine DNA glycosylase/8-oxoguanine DNA glycosylase
MANTPRAVLDPNTCRRAVRHLRRSDPVLARVLEAVGPCRYERRTQGTPFSQLLRAILYQQISGKAAASIHARLVQHVGRPWPRPEDIQSASDADLRAVGLSRQKIVYLRDLSERARGGLPLHRLSRLDDDAVVEALTQVKGIGRWTAHMYLIFRLGRPDVLPVDDYGIRKAMQLAYRRRALPDPEWMRRRAEAWRPYRSLACWYLWRTLDVKAP